MPSRGATEVSRGLTTAMNRFIQSQEAVRDLAEFSEDHVVALDSDSALATALAKDVFPPLPQNKAQAVYNRTKSLQNSISERSSASNKGSEESWNGMVTRQFSAWMNDMRKLGVSHEGAIGYITRLVVTQGRPKRHSRLLESLLIMAVSDFENFLAGLARQSLKWRPQSLGESGATYSWKEISAHSSLEAFTNSCVDKYVDNLMRSPVKGVIPWLTKVTRLSEAEVAGFVTAIEEPIQRRHLFVHTGGVVSRDYLEALSGVTGLANLGETVGVDRKYLDEATDALAVVAAIFMHASLVALKKTAGAEKIDSADDVLAVWVRDLLVAKRYLAAARVSAYLLPKIETANLREMVRAYSIVAERSLNGAGGASAEALKNWDVSALRNEFKLYKVAIEGDMAKASRLCARLIHSKELAPVEVYANPVLAEIRDMLERGDETLDKALPAAIAESTEWLGEAKWFFKDAPLESDNPLGDAPTSVTETRGDPDAGTQGEVTPSAAPSGSGADETGEGRSRRRSARRASHVDRDETKASEGHPADAG